MTTTEAGDFGKGLTIADLLQRGLKVALPLGEDSRYDLIADDTEGRLLRIQCKATLPKNGTLRVKCRSTSSWASKTRTTHKYTSTDIDLIAAVDLQSKKVYYIPAAELGTGKSEICLRLVKPKNGQSSGVRMADDYTVI